MKNIIINFENYLINSIGISKKSLKYYRSDLLHFSQWIILKIKTLGILADELYQTIPFISIDLAKEYKSYLTSNNFALKTVNRRLSTLRHFSRFLVVNDILNFDFMADIENHMDKINEPIEDKIIREFSTFLSSQKVSQNTSKNYIADIKQFLTWLNNQQITETKI